MTRVRWQIASSLTEIPVLERLRALRGLDGSAPEEIHDPGLMLDMDKAVERITRALRDRERIVVFGDYDADGVTSTALLYAWLRSVGARVSYILPHRVEDGYGLKAAMIDRVLEAKAQLLITVDNGTSANEALERAAAEGVDTIVVDHHAQTGELPPAVAILNPNRREDHYPFKGLAAVGVAFKLLQAMNAENRISYLDLVALGTVADMAPLKGENRLLVRRGLRVLNESPRPGIRALMSLARLDEREISGRSISWQLGPRINCAGRMESADLALEVLLAPEESTARRLAQRLESVNQLRQEIQREAIAGTEAALKKALEETGQLDRAVIMVGDDWHLGVIGLVSGRITSEYNRPSIAFTRVLGDGVVKGSARSVPGFDITAAIGEFRHLLEEFGGHREAAGLTLREENLQTFINGFTALANREITEEPERELAIDCELLADEVDLGLLESIAELAPFGTGNPFPVFLLRDCTVTRRFVFGQGKHLKLWVEAPLREAGAESARRFEVLCWSGGKREQDYPYGKAFDLAFELGSNRWNGETQLQLVLQDARPVELRTATSIG
ncbi:MAG: single-stranded-DNA-specific exonuclease RecJ [Candidatus Delongbacteria bacterium]|nr:single-stranded-DNA-specific exonuclease RecJ [Candidatus Delongbacteria bacterium]